MKERVLAIFGAVALIVVAIVVRSVVTDDDQQTGGGGGKGQRPVVACTPDLMAVCQALADDGKIASDPPALDLGDDAMADDTIDGWITWDPAPGIANIDAPGTWGPSRALGSSPLGVAARSNEGLLIEGCPDNGDPTWACLAQPGPAVGVGTGRTAESLARIYPIAAALVPDDSDFRAISESDLTAILDSPTVGQAAFPEQVRTLKVQPGALNLLVGPKGALDGARGLRVTVPAPATTVAVILAQRDGDGAVLGDAFDGTRTQEALRDAGVTPGEGKLAPEDRAGDLFAVRQKVG